MGLKGFQMRCSLTAAWPSSQILDQTHNTNLSLVVFLSFDLSIWPIPLHNSERHVSTVLASHSHSSPTLWYLSDWMQRDRYHIVPCVQKKGRVESQILSVAWGNKGLSAPSCCLTAVWVGHCDRSPQFSHNTANLQPLGESIGNS